MDGVFFVYKSNDARQAQGRVGRKRSEGLQITTKGSKDLGGGKRLHFMVAIAYGKGVILAEQYVKINAEFFYLFIRRNLPKLSEISVKAPNDSKIFIMDNDPSQTSAKTRAVMEQLSITMQKKPQWFSDLNPVKSIFHEVAKRMKLPAKQNVQHQTWTDFVSFVKFIIWTTSKTYIDKTILNMPKRLEDICQRGT